VHHIDPSTVSEPGPALPVFPMARECPFQPPTRYAELRTADPVARVTTPSGQLNWLVTPYDLVRGLLTDPRLSSDRANPGFPMPIPIPEEMKRELIRVSGALLGLDPPAHAQRRRMLTGEFTVRRLAALRPRVQAIVDEFLDQLLAQPRPVDLVQAFALPVPSLVICELMGVPYADRDLFQRRTVTILDRSCSPAARAEAAIELGAYFEDLITAKERDPGDDVLGRVIIKNRETGAFDHDALVGLAMLLQLAGHETTANMIALGVAGLLRQPEQQAALLGDARSVSGAVEEMLRFSTILDTVYRVAVDDLEVAGTTIRCGDGVILALSAANHDERVFAEPGTLDTARPARSHLSFAHGVHQCIGQNLARLELEVVFPALLRRIPGLRAAVPLDQLPFKHFSDAYGVFELPVTW
jgi:cytochrome P450